MGSRARRFGRDVPGRFLEHQPQGGIRQPDLRAALDHAACDACGRLADVAVQQVARAGDHGFRLIRPASTVVVFFALMLVFEYPKNDSSIAFTFCDTMDFTLWRIVPSMSVSFFDDVD